LKKAEQLFEKAVRLLKKAEQLLKKAVHIFENPEHLLIIPRFFFS